MRLRWMLLLLPALRPQWETPADLGPQVRGWLWSPPPDATAVNPLFIGLDVALMLVAVVLLGQAWRLLRYLASQVSPV